MYRKQFTHTYEHIISVENLLEAWKEFIRGKRNKIDVQSFQYRLLDNLLALHTDLKNKTYMHGGYHAFNISDPKPRNIHKATVRDRLLHHAIHRILYPFFDRTFIADSYSCRIGKGTHKALARFTSFTQKVSQNNTRTCWILKCDIRKFFASIDQEVLLTLLGRHIPDPDTMWLLERVIKSFESIAPNKGLPLGNLTSQLMVNVYMNTFDQFVKHELRQEYYVRYADDFVFMSHDKEALRELLPKVGQFLESRLHLALHPDKVHLSTLASGVDFLGWVHFPDHRVLRTATKKRMLRNITVHREKTETVQSYLGVLRWGNGYRIQKQIASYGAK